MLTWKRDSKQTGVMCSPRGGCRDVLGCDAGSKDSPPPQTSAEIAAVLGHSSAAFASKSGITEHPSPVSPSTNGIPQASSQGDHRT